MVVGIHSSTTVRHGPSALAPCTSSPRQNVWIVESLRGDPEDLCQRIRESHQSMGRYSLAWQNYMDSTNHSSLPNWWIIGLLRNASQRVMPGTRPQKLAPLMQNLFDEDRERALDASYTFYELHLLLPKSLLNGNMQSCSHLLCMLLRRDWPMRNVRFSTCSTQYNLSNPPDALIIGCVV